MRILLDTHLLLWALAAPERLPAGARRTIDRATVYVSAASIWEISVKIALGKPRVDPRDVLEAIGPSGFLELPVSGEHAARVATLPPITRDPFDRLLVAQAVTEPLRLLTNDVALADYGELVTVV